MRLLSLLTLALCLAAGSVCASAEPRSQSFALPNHGSLLLILPEGWHSQIRQPPNDLPPTLTLGPDSGRDFQVLITPIWPIGNAGRTDEASLRSATRAAAADARSQAVEPELQLKELGGRSGRGFYFSATDKAPKPGEYKYLTQGMIRVGEIALAFTVLTNDGQADIVKDALQVIATAMRQ